MDELDLRCGEQRRAFIRSAETGIADIHQVAMNLGVTEASWAQTDCAAAQSSRLQAVLGGLPRRWISGEYAYAEHILKALRYRIPLSVC